MKGNGEWHKYGQRCNAIRSGEWTLLRHSLKDLASAVSGSVSLFHMREVNLDRRDTRVCQRLLVLLANPIDPDDLSL